MFCSRGLGIERFLGFMLRLFNDPAHLVLVLNTGPKDRVRFLCTINTEWSTVRMGVKLKIHRNKFESVKCLSKLYYLLIFIFFECGKVSQPKLFEQTAETAKYTWLLS